MRLPGARTLLVALSPDVLFATGVRRRPLGWLRGFVTLWGTGVALYVLYAAGFAVLSPWELAAHFLCAMFPLVFLTSGAFPGSDPHRPHPVDWLLAALGVATLVYFAAEAGRITERISLFDPLSAPDYVFGSLVLILALEATRRATGLALALLAVLLGGYNLYGHLLDGVLRHGLITYSHFLDMQVFTSEGVFGLPARVAATYAFLFIMFGTLLQRAGGGDFFFNVAAALSGRRVGGPAKVAVISSGLYGTVSGSPTADVVTTGAITIPMMKRLGYPALTAGAVEVAASTGGSLLPPVMGSAAFIMAEYTGIPYREIAIAALLPALLYYLNVYAQTHYTALRQGLRGMPEVPPLPGVLRRGWIFIVPLVVLVWGLLAGYTATRVALFGLATLLVIAVARCRSRGDVAAVFSVLAETTVRVGPLVGAVAAAGLVLAGINITGLAGKVALLFDLVSGDSLFLTLLFAAGLSILLGMGMPTPSAYVLAAALLGPYLVDQMGLSMLVAHMFLLYYAVLSAVTPPIAVAAYAASTLADVSPLALSVRAVRFCLGAFVVPFVFVYRPSLLLQGSALDTAVSVVVAALGFVALAVAFEGYYRGPLRRGMRLLVGAAGVAVLTPEWATGAAGVLVLALLAGSRHGWFLRGAAKATPAGEVVPTGGSLPECGAEASAQGRRPDEVAPP